MIASLSRGNLLDVLQEGFNEQQLQAYVSWVNSQLRRRPGLQPVQDLRRDLRDGVVLAHLVEIVAGELLEGVHYSPADPQEMRENVEKVLQFVASKRIHLNNHSSKFWSIKNISTSLTLAFALTTHRQPATRLVGDVHSVPGRHQAQGHHTPESFWIPAATGLAGGEPLRSGSSASSARRRSSSVDEEIENPSWSVRALVQQYEGQREAPAGDSEALPSGLSSPSPAHTPKGELAVGQSESQEAKLSAQLEEARCKAEVLVMAPLGGPVGAGEGSSWEDQLLEQQEQLEREMEEARRMISSLQKKRIVINQAAANQKQSPLETEENNIRIPLFVIINKNLNVSFKKNRKPILHDSDRPLGLSLSQDALQQRMSLQESSVLQLKQELLRASMARDELHSQNISIVRIVDKQSTNLAQAKKELGHKDRLLQQQQLKLDEALRKVAERAEEQAARGSLSPSLCACVPQSRGKSPGRRAAQSDRDSWPPSSKMSHSHSSPVLSSSATTKVLYFTDRSLTPFMVNIPKRLGEVTLRDFKAAVDREGSYRYHFKALDPEFGTVKEEVFHDDAVVPGWEGKIVAW
uniref:DIX domain containing 1a n=1 Tax=Lepisosteus oculatus TaxID=7918 RepID=W5LZY8_LEPOC